MKIIEEKLSPVITDVLCDDCSCATTPPGGSPEFGVLSALWGYGSEHDGERYEIHLCESCFFATLSNLRRQRMVEHMFDDAANQAGESGAPFGLVERGNYFKG